LPLSRLLVTLAKRFEDKIKNRDKKEKKRGGITGELGSGLATPHMTFGKQNRKPE